MRRASPFVEAMAGVGVVAAGLIAMMTILATRTASAPPVPPKANRIVSFEENWRAAGMTVAMPATPTRVTTERIVMADVIVADATSAPQQVAELPAAKTAKPARDICRGKGRVYTRNGKIWRCKK